MMTQIKNSNSQSGNAFFIVMLGVVLFGALMFTFSRGARQGNDNLSSKQAEIAATDIISYAQLVERGVSRVYSKGFSESNISFENNLASGYTNVSCTTNRCRVFEPSGGAIPYRRLQDSWSSSTSDWIFTGHNQVLSIGTNCAAASCSELMMMIEDVPEPVCMAINEKLGVTAADTSPPDDNGVDTDPYLGSFAYDANADIGDENAALDGERTGCLFETGNVNYFYHTLLER